MAEPIRVFVSHHHSPEEDRFAAQLVSDLIAAGADVSVNDQGITSDDVVQQISAGLDGRQWLVLVMTPAALRSTWVRRAVNGALHLLSSGRMRGVIPLVAQHCDEAEIPPPWATLQRYDATRDYAAALAKLVGALSLAVPGGRPPQAAAPPPPATLAPAALHRPGAPRPLLKRLHELGYAAREVNGVEVLLPPLCDIPAGPFTMGSDKTRDPRAESWEMPQHGVATGAYQIARFPVTVAEYACAVRARAVREPATRGRSSWRIQQQRLDHPVVGVSWRDAVAYAAWLATLTSQPWRLPTEAEWEKAARGTDERLFPWGDQWDQTRANTREGGAHATTPVGRYPSGASPYGPQDLAGNVWEWCSSLYQPYPYRANDGREQLDAPGGRVLRGGSWSLPPRFAHAAYRVVDDPSTVGGNVGFRLVLVAPGSV